MLVLGLGNPDRGDDAVGRLVARRLRARQRRAARASWLRRVEIAEHGGDAASLIERLEGAGFALLVDACRTGARPGSVHRFDASVAPLPVALDTSTHGLGLASALELARVLERLPARCIVYGIEAQRLAPGAALSDAVRRALEPLEQRLLAELAPGGAPRAGGARDGFMAGPGLIARRSGVRRTARERQRPGGGTPRRPRR